MIKKNTRIALVGLALAAFSLSFTAEAADGQATAVKLISMPGVPGGLMLVDVGVMPKLDKGMMMILCDAQCQGVLHLVGKPTPDNNQVAMGVTLYVDNHSTAAKLLGGK